MFCLAGCNKGNIDTKEAVRQGVIDYFASKKDVNVGSMKVDVSAVTFKENEADATVAVLPRGGEGQPMTFRYTLERKGNRWVVKPKAGGSGHGAMPAGANPHGAMPPAGAENPAGGMPPGHPAVPESTRK
jgi:hypothetical protein